MIISALGIFLLVGISFTNLLLGSLVFLRNTKLLVNRMFMFVAVSVSLWSATNLISDNTENFELSRITSSLAFSAGFLSLCSMSLFAYTLRRPNSLNRKKYFVIGLIITTLFVLYATPMVYNLTTLDDYENGILYAPYLLNMVALLVFITVNFRKRIKSGTTVEKNQTRIIMYGATIMTFAAVMSNIILPIFITASWTTRIGPLFSLFFIASISYAIRKHKLFDFRSAVARSATYIGLTLFIVINYALFGFIIKELFLPDSAFEIGQLIANVILAIILIFTYPLIKKLVDRITNKVFFHDAYDSQELLNSLNKVLVSNLEIDKLLSESSAILETALKAEFCSFVIQDTAYFATRQMGDKAVAISEESRTKIQEILPKLPSKVVYVDEEHTEQDEKEVAKLVHQSGGDVLVRIVSDINGKSEGIGYMLLGPKRSGNLYTSQDLVILEIIANELVIAIENALRFEEIEQFNVTLQQKVNDATHELRRTNEKLKALDEAKDEFISMASHQLRTPLTSVKGYLSMLDEGDAGKLNANQKQFVNQAFVSSQRMVYLIADLLNVSRLKTGKFIIEAVPVYLPDLIESEIAQLYETVKSRGITMKFDKPKEFTTLNLDETKIRQVVMNFTDNAIYYTPKGGEVNLHLQETPTTIEFTVTDDGIGVPKEDQHHLFTKFYRAGNARKSRPDGTGLGLFMAKKVVAAQGGAIIFKSQEGKGSTFGFSFAKEKLAVPTKQA